MKTKLFIVVECEITEVGLKQQWTEDTLRENVPDFVESMICGCHRDPGNGEASPYVLSDPTVYTSFEDMLADKTEGVDHFAPTP